MSISPLSVRASFGRTLLLAAGALSVMSSPAGAMSVGFNDEDLAKYGGAYGATVDEPALAAGLAHGKEAGSSYWRFSLSWRSVATTPTAPTAAEAVDPRWSGYRWDYPDRMVRAISAAGLQPLPWVAKAPDWAEGANRPSVSDDVPAGTWQPKAQELSRFAQAVAKRYSGTFPDPLRAGAVLPRVTYFQAWNEPNLYTEINPQWKRSGARWRPASPEIYRGLLNAFYSGIKTQQPSATVLSAGTGPFGDLKDGDPRIPPVRFARELLCVKASGVRLAGTKTCGRVRFDGWAHHTYPIGPPTRTARNKDDAVVPDMKKLTAVVQAARRAGTVAKKAAANIWITEMSWDSAPDPNGLSLEDHATYMQGAFYVLWKAGIDHVMWWNSRDEPRGSDWNATLQSGIFSRGATPVLDTPKPSFTAFRFSFAAYRSKGVAALWAKPPGTGPVTVQAQTGAEWKTVATLQSARGGVVTGRLRTGPGVTLRAVQGAETSIPWRTF